MPLLSTVEADPGLTIWALKLYGNFGRTLCSHMSTTAWPSAVAYQRIPVDKILSLESLVLSEKFISIQAFKNSAKLIA